MSGPGCRCSVENIVEWRSGRSTEIPELNSLLTKELDSLESPACPFLAVRKRPTVVHRSERNLGMDLMDARIGVSDVSDVQDPRSQSMRLCGHSEPGPERHLKELTAWGCEDGAGSTAQECARRDIGSSWTKPNRHIDCDYFSAA
jgi:hypothetical protein